jgi:mannosyltransferase OCH1-like enzyme
MTETASLSDSRGVQRPGKRDALPIIQYWHSAEIPVEVAELIATFGHLNPELRHLVFSESEAERFIAENFTEREVAAFRCCAVPAMQADYFRNCGVLALGGIYSDADFLCRRPLQALVDTVDGGILFENSLGHTLNSFFVFPAPGHPLLRLLLDVTTENIERRVADRVHEVTGPWVVSLLRALLRRGSLEAARRDASGRMIERLAESIIHATGNYDRVAEAFEGVCISPVEAAWEWIAKPESKLLYKEGELHWENWHRQGRKIFK